MKHIITLTLVFFYFHAYSQIVIKGKIHNYDGETKVFYSPTIEGIAVPYGKEIVPGPNGKFRIQYENEGYGTVSVFFNKMGYRFFHDGKAEIYVEIDQDKINFPKHYHGYNVIRDHILDSIKQEATKVISGDFEEVNKFYNKNIRSAYVTTRSVGGDYYSQLIKNATTPDEVIAIVDSLTQIELNQIAHLNGKLDTENLGSKVIDENVKEFLENEVHAFYGSIFLQGMFLKRKEQVNKLYKDPSAPLNIYNRGWEKLIENFFTEMPNTIVPAANSRDFNEFVLNLEYTKSTYKKYHYNSSPKSFDEYLVEGLLQPDSAILDTLYSLDKKSAFAYKLSNLSLYTNSQPYYSPVLLHSINELKNRNPGSAHFEHFEPQIEKLKAYLKSSAEKYDKAKIVEKNYLHFNDLLETFKGKNILIDIWATWCGPCIEDFNYKSILQPFIDEGELTVLYVSIDKQRWENKWRENMKYNQLEGYHVLADDVLISDMWEVLGGMNGAIPRYALVDKEGKIFLNEAARPSQSKKLIEQINNLISTSDK